MTPPRAATGPGLCAVTASRLHLLAALGFRIDDKDLRRAGLDYWDKVHAATWSSFDELLEVQAVGTTRLHLFTGHGGPPPWGARAPPGAIPGPPGAGGGPPPKPPGRFPGPPGARPARP